MKSLLRSSLAATCALALATFAAASDEPGYVDIGQLMPSTKGQFVEVNLSPALMKFAARIAKAHEPEAAEIVGDIKRVRINVVSLDDTNRDATIEKIESVRTQLEQQGWTKMVTVREQEKGDDVAIFAKMRTDDAIDGIVVTVFNRKGEAVFVNVVGTINPDKIATLAEKYDIEPLRHVKVKVNKKA
jgi:hypothetical protein